MFRMADWVTKIDEDDDLGRICGEYVCDWCEETGDWGEIEHDDNCPIGEIQCQARDADDFLGPLAARDQEVAVLCATAKKVISLVRHRGDRELIAALKNLQVAIDMAQNEIVVDRGNNAHNRTVEM